MTDQDPPPEAPSGVRADAADAPGALELLRQVPVAVVVGVGCGASLIGLTWLAEQLQHLVWDDLPTNLGVGSDAAWWTLLILTATGLVTGLLVWLVPGHAGPDPAPMELVSEPLPAYALPGLAVALVLTLAGGVSLGPENPILALNASLVALLGVRFLPAVPVAGWMGLSLAATIGAMFGTPVAAALLLTEVLAGQEHVRLWDRMFAPLWAAGAGSATMLALSDMDLGLGVPAYDGFEVGDLAIGIAIALFSCAVGLAAAYALTPVHTLFHRISHPVAMLTLGGLVLGLLGMVGGRETLFKGLDQMKDVSAHVSDYTNGDLWLMAGIKLVALVVAAAASFRGGRIFPVLFVGVVAGWAVAGTFDGIPPSLAISCAVLGIVLAATRSGWLSLFIAAALVPDPQLLPILVLAVLPAWLLTKGRPELRARPPVPASP